MLDLYAWRSGLAFPQSWGLVRDPEGILVSDNTAQAGVPVSLHTDLHRPTSSPAPPMLAQA